ncbi:type I restriction-modification system M protein [Streptococcus pneumoniae]|nr:type I restriction-modification system M protein [Streptococcus pneumoniae]
MASCYAKSSMLLMKLISIALKIVIRLNDIYEKILKDIQNAGNSGEFYTPRAATDFIAEVLDPKNLENQWQTLLAEQEAS